MHYFNRTRTKVSRRLNSLATKTVWCLPVALYAADANAWGLFTHLYFAQSLLWAMPLLDPRLQNAIKRFPNLVMAGACLPDLAIVSRKFKQSHSWDNAHDLLKNAQSDEEIALAIGYASHLYVDVIAHNHFVPAHEAMWSSRFNWWQKFRKTPTDAHSMLTHIASEWAMDAYLAPLMNTSPRQLLTEHSTLITAFIQPQFKRSSRSTLAAIKRLAFWDGVLRAVKLPTIIFKLAGVLDRRIVPHFMYYIAETQVAVENIGTVLNGNKPVFEAELKHLNAAELAHWRQECLSHLSLQHPSPIQYFEPTV